VHRRVLWLLTGIFGCLAVLFGRLFLLMSFPDQVVGGDGPPGRWQSGVRVRADLEHFAVIRTDDARGRILYRNGAAWSGREVRDLSQWIHREDVPPAHGKVVVGQVGKPDVWPAPGMAVAEVGRSGLEYSFDTILRGYRPGYVARLAAAKDDKRTFSTSPKSGLDVRTTIDAAWQSAAENALSEAKVRDGAVVVLDVQTNEIRALASIGGRSGANEGVASCAPGSIFKIVTAAAAYDSFRFRPNSAFFCNGYVPVKGVRMACWAKHGQETLSEALAASCDTVFAEVGIAVGRYAIAHVADSLGLNADGLQRVDGRPVLPEVQAGRVFVRAGNDAGLLANTAIGQEDVRLSPLQAARLASAVAHRGQTKPAVLVTAATQHGQVLRDYTTDAWRSAFSPFAAAEIATSMRLAVTSRFGTAHDLDDLPLAVKTGTAEVPTGGHVNAWMIGYLPVNHPQIAFAVVSKDAQSATAHVAVRKIVRALTKTYMQFHGQRHI